MTQWTQDAMAARLVRYADLVPCRTAFIDARTPGSTEKENFTIIGPGVSESADQFVHITEKHGFNIGAALFVYWLARVPKKASKNTKSKESKQEKAK